MKFIILFFVFVNPILAENYLYQINSDNFKKIPILLRSMEESENLYHLAIMTRKTGMLNGEIDVDLCIKSSTNIQIFAGRFGTYKLSKNNDLHSTMMYINKSHIKHSTLTFSIYSNEKNKKGVTFTSTIDNLIKLSTQFPKDIQEFQAKQYKK